MLSSEIESTEMLLAQPATCGNPKGFDDMSLNLQSNNFTDLKLLTYSGMFYILDR